MWADLPTGGGDSEIFDEYIDATDTQRNTALANVSNQTANTTTGKMGYKVLDPTRTFAQQVTAENTIYEIRDVFDLGGTQETPVSVTLPAGSTLKFNGGIIKNGNLSFNQTRIEGGYKFENSNYSGTIIIDSIDDRYFTSSNDIAALAFILSNGISNGCKVDIWRNYTIAIDDYIVVVSDKYINAEFDFHGHTIENTINIENGHKALFSITNCNYLYINNLNFVDAANTMLTQDKSFGFAIVHCFGDCSNINIVDCSQTYGDTPIRSGMFDYNSVKSGTFGLTDSILKLKTYNVSYSSAIYLGSNLDINVFVENCHRGLYISGLSNSTIKYTGTNPQHTGTHVLLTDGLFTDYDSSVGIKGCSDLNIDIVVPSTSLSGEEHLIGISSYDTKDFTSNHYFNQRTSPCVHSNISVKLTCNQIQNTAYPWLCSISGNVIANNIVFHDSFCNFNDVPSSEWIDFGKLTSAEVFVRNCKATGSISSIRFRNTGNSSIINLHVENSDVSSIGGISGSFTGVAKVFADKIMDSVSQGDGKIEVFLPSVLSSNLNIGNSSNFLVEQRKPVTVVSTISNSYDDLIAIMNRNGRTTYKVNICHNINLNNNRVAFQAMIINFEGGSLSNGIIAGTNIMLTGNVKLTNIQFAGDGSNLNFGNTRPSMTDKIIGTPFFDNNTGFKKPVWWNGIKWVDSNGYPAESYKGDSSSRPANLGATDSGFQYYDTTLNKYICWNGTAWVNLDGTALS